MWKDSGTSVQERASQPSVSTMRTKIEQASPQSRAALLTFLNGRLNFNQSFETIRRPSSRVLKAPAFLDPQQTGAGAFFKRDEAPCRQYREAAGFYVRSLEAVSAGGEPNSLIVRSRRRPMPRDFAGEAEQIAKICDEPRCPCTKRSMSPGIGTSVLGTAASMVQRPDQVVSVPIGTSLMWWRVLSELAAEISR